MENRDHIYIVHSNGSATHVTTRCEAYTRSNNRCSRFPVTEYAGLELCTQHEQIAMSPSKLDYWQYRKGGFMAASRRWVAEAAQIFLAKIGAELSLELVQRLRKIEGNQSVATTLKDLEREIKRAL